MALRSIFQDETHRDLERRLKALRPEAPARFGRMSAHEAVCHLTDAFLIVLGDRPTRFRADSWFNRTVGRVVALSTPVPWPRGIPTSPEADQERGGTPPGDFDEDRTELLRQMSRFRATGGRGLDPHVALGALTPAEWGRWGFRHLDHHLRQFGA
jgi:hypothetical protein